MLTKKFFSTIIVLLGLILVLSFSVVADDAEYVYLTVEKFTIGQGYVLEPTRYELQEGDTVYSLLIRAIGEDNVIMTQSQWGDYLSGIKDNGADEADIPQFILDEIVDESVGSRAVQGTLSNLDYTSQSGWFYIVNNMSGAVSIDSFELTAGDVVRISFSVYGYGTDIGFGYDAETQKTDASYIEIANRDELIKAIADAKAEGADAESIEDAITISANLEATQTEIDDAVAELTTTDNSSEADDSSEDVTPPATGDCGLHIALLIAVISGTAVFTGLKRAK